jgi:hypothetical protein
MSNHPFVPCLPARGRTQGRRGGGSSLGESLGVEVAMPRNTTVATTQAAVFAGEERGLL